MCQNDVIDGESQAAGILVSPQYPEKYADDQECEQLFRIPPGMVSCWCKIRVAVH